MTSSAALSLLALLLFAASTPLLVHSQFFSFPPINFPPISFPPINLPGLPPINIPPISFPPIVIPPIGVPPVGIPPIGVPPVGIPPIGVPPVGIPPTGAPPIGSPLPALINVTGQLCCTANGTCPGQGLPGVPATLTCLTNSVTSIVAQTVTNDNGTFTLNTVSNVPLSILPECVVTIVRSAVDATTCSVLSTTGDILLSAVQFIGQTVGRVLNGTASVFVPI